MHCKDEAIESNDAFRQGDVACNGNESQYWLYVQIVEMLSLDRKEEGGGSPVAAFATAVMVQMGKLPLEALQPVR